LLSQIYTFDLEATLTNFRILEKVSATPQASSLALPTVMYQVRCELLLTSSCCDDLTHVTVADVFALAAVAAIENWYELSAAMPKDLRWLTS
jgi:hypothetical protein